MTENVRDIGAWITRSNAFEVMGELRRLGLLTRADLKKAMRLNRQEWITFMKEKAGIVPETKNEKG